MLKFWKKKPVEPTATPDVAPPEERVEKAADTASIDAGPVVSEALAEAVLPEPEAPEVEPDVEEASIVDVSEEERYSATLDKHFRHVAAARSSVAIPSISAR